MVIGIDVSPTNRQQKTGTEWYAYHIVKALAQIDQKNQYILYSKEALTGDLATICQQQVNFKNQVLDWPLKYGWSLLRLSGQMLISPPDVLFVPAHVLPLLSRARLVNTIHDVGFMALPQLYSWWSRQYLIWSTRFSLQRSKQVITVSNFSQQEIKKYFSLIRNNITTVYHGYDQELYQSSPDPVNDQAVLDQYGISGNYFIYIGRLESKKNIIGLLNGFRQYRQDHPDSNYQLVLAGQRGREFLKINNLLTDPILKSVTKELGWVPENDLPALLRLSQGLVFPSWYEGFGLPMIQAMACGTPVLAAQSGSLPEIGATAAAYFQPTNTIDLANQLHRLVSDQSWRQELIVAGLERAQQFSWTASAHQTLAIIEQAHG